MKKPRKPPFSFENITGDPPRGEGGKPDVTRLLELLAASASVPESDAHLHWDELRHRDPPGEFSHETWWAALKLKRLGMLRSTPLLDADGRPFRYALPDSVLELVRLVDVEAAGSVQSEVVLPEEFKRDRYVVKSLIEEATLSSQIEGAAATRRVAKEMIHSGRKPRTHGERMIFNNYKTMQQIRKIKDLELSPELVLDLHRWITENTLDSPDDCGRLRRPDERIEVVDHQSAEILHTPPPAEQLEERLERMCAFANGETPDRFVPPVVRSIILHFWLAYDHPFVDGNGRCARSLFYWSMLRHGYWLFEYISISRLIQRGLAKYSRAFLFTETDDNDLTYFIVYHLELLRKSIDEARQFVERNIRSRTRLLSRLERMRELNHRQRALVAHALKHPGFEYTVRSHMTRHQVTHQTSRTDLTDLVSRGLMSSMKIGRTVRYYPVDDLEERLT